MAVNSGGDQSWYWPISSATGFGTYYPQTLTHVVVPERCSCGAEIRREQVVIESRTVKASGHRSRYLIATAQREAIVCDHCGIIGWMGAEDPPGPA